MIISGYFGSMSTRSRSWSYAKGKYTYTTTTNNFQITIRVYMCSYFPEGFCIHQRLLFTCFGKSLVVVYIFRRSSLRILGIQFSTCLLGGFFRSNGSMLHEAIIMRSVYNIYYMLTALRRYVIIPRCKLCY